MGVGRGSDVAVGAVGIGLAVNRSESREGGGVSERVDRVREVLEAALAEVEAEAAGLREALRSLDGGAPVQTPKRKRRRKARRVGSRRVARGQRPKQFLAAVEANPGASVAEVAKAMGVSANQAGSLARRLGGKGRDQAIEAGVRVAAKAGGK